MERNSLRPMMLPSPMFTVSVLYASLLALVAEGASPFRRVTAEENAVLQRKCRNPAFAADADVAQHKISNGQPVINASYYPWSAALQLPGGFTECGAIIVSPRHLITARHCLDHGAAMRLLLGGVCQAANEAEGCPAGDMIEVEMEMGRYQAKTPDDNDHTGQVKLENARHDFAIIQLRNDLNITEELRHACLPNVDTLTPTEMRVYGWGVTHDKVTSTRLMVIFMDVVDGESLSPYGAQFCSDERLVCMRAEDGSQDACKGDSGSGVLGPDVNMSRDGYPLLYGTTVLGLTEQPINVATRTQFQVIDICYYLGVCVKKEWVDEGVDALESQVFVKFDSDYTPPDAA